MPEREIPKDASDSLDREPLLARPRMLAGYLHGGAVSLAADQRGGDIGVCILVIQINHIGHPAWQEQLIPLIGLVLEQNAVDVAT